MFFGVNHSLEGCPALTLLWPKPNLQQSSKNTPGDPWDQYPPIGPCMPQMMKVYDQRRYKMKMTWIVY